MVGTFGIIMAVKRGKERREVEAELAEARRECQEAAEERQRMHEEFEAHMHNSNGSNSSLTYPPASAYSYEAVEPLGVPVHGVPLQSLPPAAAPAAAVYQSNEQPMSGATVVVYCDRCGSYHAPPVCPPLSRRERRAERREKRHDRREQRREERHDRREERRNR